MTKLREPAPRVSRRRSLFEAAQRRFYCHGWASRIAFNLGFQGRISVRSEVFLTKKIALRRPLRFVFLADLHAGPLTDTRLLDRAFAIAEGFAPDLVLLGGDYVSLGLRNLPQIVHLIRGVRAPLGVAGVLGNHDQWQGEELSTALRKAGLRFLSGLPHQLGPPFEDVTLYGVDAGAEASLASYLPQPGLRSFSLLVAHSPRALGFSAEGRFDLILSGHTHGGQVAFPSGRALFLPSGSGDAAHVAGRFRVGATDLLVTRGIGLSDIPIRLNSPSEVHLCQLRSVES
jgi:uncharacterized protein